MNVDRDLVSILKNGSRTGYLFEPHSDKCSSMCGMPVLSLGVVRNATLMAHRQHFLDQLLHTRFFRKWTAYCSISNII